VEVAEEEDVDVALGQPEVPPEPARVVAERHPVGAHSSVGEEPLRAAGAHGEGVRHCGLP